MKLLWVRRRPMLEGGGDAIVDTKFAKELARTLDVTVYTVERLPRAAKLRRALTRRLPPDRASFGTEADVERIAELARQADAVMFSHEQLDTLAIDVAQRLGRAKPYTGLLLHNVPSDAFPQLASRPVVGHLAGRLLTWHERRTFGNAGIDDIFTLSHRDARLVARLSGRTEVPVVHPGAPPEVPLQPGAILAPDLVIIGTFEWFPKRRDMLTFAKLYAEGRGVWGGPAPQVYLSPGAEAGMVAALRARPLDELDFAKNIRFGLVTDRFVSGHKLKVSEYFARNLIPISFSAIEEDFGFSAAARSLITEVRTLEELSARMQALAALPADQLRATFLAAKREVLDTMSWTRQAGVLEARIRGALGRPSGACASPDRAPPLVAGRAAGEGR